MSSHPEKETLILLVTGELGPDRSDEVLDHLGRCESCLEVAADAWAAVPGFGETLGVPAMDQRNRTAIEQKLFERIHLAEFGNRVTWFVTDGFLAVLFVLLQPVLASRHSVSEEG